MNVLAPILGEVSIFFYGRDPRAAYGWIGYCTSVLYLEESLILRHLSVLYSIMFIFWSDCETLDSGIATELFA